MHLKCFAEGGKGERWCRACCIWRPHHAHHCRDCNRCVAHFDHHCDTVDACIGQLNQRWLTLFLLCACGGSGLLLVAAAHSLVQMWRLGALVWA